MKTLFTLEIEMPNGLYEFIVKDIGNGHFSLTNQLYGILMDCASFLVDGKLAELSQMVLN